MLKRIGLTMVYLLSIVLTLTACGILSTPNPMPLTWERIPHKESLFGGPNIQIMNAVTAGGPGLVAVGIDWSGGNAVAAVWTSVDGIEWQRLAHDESVFGGNGNQWMEAVTVGGPGLVAVGGDWEDGEGVAAVWTSADGTSWQRVPHTESAFGCSYEKGEKVGPFTAENVSATMKAIVQGGPGLVAVGTDQVQRIVGTAAVWTSPDGVNWNRVEHHGDVFHDKDVVEMLAVTAGGPGLVAVGSSGEFGAAAWTSVDGLTWQRIPHDDDIFGERWPIMQGVTAGGPGLVAVGHDLSIGEGVAAVWTSADGIAWQRIAHKKVFAGSDTVGMRAVAAGGPGLVAVGFDASREAAAVWTSVDGIEWQRTPDANGFANTYGMLDVTAGGPGFVAVGSTRQQEDQDAVVWAASIDAP